MGPRSAVVVLTVLALSGCGGDDDQEDAVQQDSVEQDAVAQDRQAKSNARNLTVAVEACFVERQDYTGCTEPAGAGEAGDAEVDTATATEFTIVSPSESGNEFRLIRGKDGSITRECEEPGEAGCPAGGSW